MAGVNDDKSPPTSPPTGDDEPSFHFWKDADREVPVSLNIRIGKYELKREIAAGGMGVVYEAVQEEPRRVVAVKLMRNVGLSASWLRRFKFEAQLLARLRHPNIAQVYEGGTHGEGSAAVPFFAMEYVPAARNILEYARVHQLPLNRKIELFISVCSAVEHAHSKGIIHRDIKPANVLVDCDGCVKVIDFGVARALDTDLASAEAQTSFGSLLGTLQYMSPEQCDGDPSAVDARADVYSLGVLLYELVCGMSPYKFEKPGVTEAARVICEQKPKLPASIDPRLRGDVETVLLKALQKERDRRYQRAQDLGEDLRRLLSGDPIEARRDSTTYILRKRSAGFVARHRIVTPILLLFVTLIVAETFLRPALFRWTTLGGWIDKQIIDQLAGHSPVSDPFESVRMIAFSDSTDVSALTRKENLPVVDPSTKGHFRQLHGRVLERLARTNVRTVVMDFSFVGETEFDAEFVRGVQALKARGVDVVVGVPRWDFGLGEMPLISRTIAPHVRCGGATAGIGAPIYLDVLVQQPDAEPVPSIALLGIASFRQPGAQISLNFLLMKSMVEIAYLKPHPSQPLSNVIRVQPDTISLSLTDREPEGTPHTGINKGDLVGRLVIQVPADEAINAISVPYESVLELTENELRQHFDDRIAMFGDIRSNSEDWFATADGRQVPGAFVHVVGIDAMLRKVQIRVASGYRHELTMMSSALLGILAAIWAFPSIFARIGTVLLIVVGAVVLCVLLFTQLAFLVNPALVAGTACLGFGAMLLAERIRVHRHI